MRVGMIIACKTFTAHSDALLVGDQVTVHVRRIGGNETISHFNCELLRENAMFSTAVLTLYHAKQRPVED